MNNKTVKFEEWFANVAETLELHKDINHPSNRDYDYIAAYYAGVPVPKPGQELPSEHKGELHENRFVPYGDTDEDNEFYDSKSGITVGIQHVIVQDIKRESHLDNFLENEAE